MRKTIKFLLVIVIAAVAVITSLVLLNNNRFQVIGKEKNNSPRLEHKTLYVNDLPINIKSYGNKAKVYLKNDLSSIDEINQYVEKRKNKLLEIATENPFQEIEVVISPSEQTSLKEFKDKSALYNLSINRMALDLFVDDKWSRMAEFDNTSTVIDINQDAESIEKRIIELESGNTPNKQDIGKDKNKPTREPKFTSTGIRFVRGTLPAGLAQNLQKEDSIMLVDPLSDIKDVLKKQYAEVEIVNMPQLFVLKESKFGSRYAPENTKLRLIK